MRNLITGLIVFFAIIGNVTLADKRVTHGDIASIIEEIIVEEVDRTINKARDVVREKRE